MWEREPLPWIDLASFYLDASTGTSSYQQLQNTGSAAWADRDLMIEMQTREGHIFGCWLFLRMFTLLPEKRWILSIPSLSWNLLLMPV